MIAVPRRTLILAGFLLLTIASINLGLRPSYVSEFSPTSFGTGPAGYRASFDLARELGFSAARSYVTPTQRPTGRSLWMVSPSMLQPDSAGADDAARDLLKWVDSGGTALVFGDSETDWQRLDFTMITVSSGGHASISGVLLPTTRHIAVLGLLHFEKVPTNARVTLSADGVAFAVERKRGAGRLIAFADGGFFLNSNVGDADNCLLFIDLVRKFDGVVFDEYCHGIVESSSLMLAIVRSRAMLPIAVGLILAIVWVFAQQKWPRRLPVNEPALASATIQPFVESLGVLYSRRSNPDAAFRVYRDSILRRLRPRIGPSRGFDQAAQLERMSLDQPIPDETRRWLFKGSAPRNNAELIQAARALEAFAGTRHDSNQRPRP